MKKYDCRKVLTKGSVASILLLIILHLIFFLGARLYDCGYSLFEDHEIINTAINIGQNGMAHVLIGQIKAEGVLRFRPLYVLYRVMASSLFAENIRLYHVCFYAVFLLNTILLYCWGRMFGFRNWLSFLFTLLVFCGSQSCISWRLASGESICILFLNIALILFLYGLNQGKTKFLIIAWIVLLLSVLTKESFLFCYLLFPLIYLSKFIGSNIRWKPFLALGLGAVLFISIYILALRLLLPQPDGMRYAGSMISVKEILTLQFGVKPGGSIDLYHVLRTVLFDGSFIQPYIFLIGLSLVSAWIFLPQNKLLTGIALFSLTFLIIQKLLYLRIFLFNIYMFPAVIPLAFLVVLIVNLFLECHKKYIAIILTTSLVFVVMNQLILGCQSAMAFYSENKATISVTNELSARCCPHDTIYIAADPLLHVEFIMGLQTR